MRPLPAAIRASTSSWIVAAPQRRHCCGPLVTAAMRTRRAAGSLRSLKRMALLLATPARLRRLFPRGVFRPPISAAGFGCRATSRHGSTVCAGSVSREEARAAFLAEVKDGTVNFDLLHHPLLPYHATACCISHGEQAFLADDMGLGKTVQAIAACELLARRKGIERVLVLCPASLKAEWEEEIARFTDRPARAVFGARPARLSAYREPAFFTIVNYEQVLGDAPDINEILRPDMVVLDEAQRIKNWQIKTARQVKSLRSSYAVRSLAAVVANGRTSGAV